MARDHDIHTSDDGTSGERTRSTSPTMGLVLGSLAILMLVGVAYVGINFILDPTGPDFEEMFYATGWALTGVAVAGVLIALHAMRVGSHVSDHAALHVGQAHGGSITTTAPTAGRRTGPARERKVDPVTKGGSTSKAGAARKRSPFGDVHPVIDVEGIGPKYSERLEKLKIVDTEQLWQADAEVVARELDVPVRTVRSWQAMSELMALDEIGPQYAELLVRSGFRSIDELAAAKPETVLEKVNETESDREVRVQGNPISIKYTRKWVRIASEHEPPRKSVQR